MSEIVCVKLLGSKKIMRCRWEGEEIKEGEKVIVPNDLGGELAQVVNDCPYWKDHLSNKTGINTLSKKANEEDLETLSRKSADEEKAFKFCLERIKVRELPMKLIKVIFFLNEKKGIFYFTADGRIDFRELVKDLAKEFKMRIEMRQIGVRDEAKMLGGLGVCGRVLCCHSFIRNFEPIPIQKAKDQNININPMKISGLCGRLMCCLAFEEEGGRIYVQEEELVQEDKLEE
ncbi:MAG: regulatory iron-sulfur-containing complex subunit RicT [Acidobacteriota bacterium]